MSSKTKMVAAGGVLALALVAGLRATPSLTLLGWYGSGCDDAEAQNPGDASGCLYAAREFDCADRTDNDSDERTDCADSDCEGQPSCGTPCPRTELDGDGDCQNDWTWWGSQCADGNDNDADGMYDCSDPDCLGYTECGPSTCLDWNACNYGGPGDCDYSCRGGGGETCGDSTACNYGAEGSCDYSCVCTEPSACNYGAHEACDYESCKTVRGELIPTVIRVNAYSTSTNPRAADVGAFEFTVKLEAVGGDAWVSNGYYGWQTGQFPFRFDPVTRGVNYTMYSFAPVGPRLPEDDDLAGALFIPEGTSRVFDVFVTATPTDGVCGNGSLVLEQLRWFEGEVSESAKRVVPVGARTPDLLLCGAPTYVDVAFESSSATRNNGVNPGEADSVDFKINFNVTAHGEDIFIDGDTTSRTDSDGLAWATTSDSTTGTTSVSAILLARDGYRASDSSVPGNRFFKIADGDTRAFTFSVAVPAGTDNSAVGVMVRWLRWGTDPAELMGQGMSGLDEDVFRTDLVTGLYIR